MTSTPPLRGRLGAIYALVSVLAQWKIHAEVLMSGQEMHTAAHITIIIYNTAD